MIVPEGYEYYIDSVNQYHIYSIVPYSDYNYRVEVLYPISPETITTEAVKPEVTLNDFRKWIQSADMLVRDEHDILYHLTKLLIEIGRDIVEYDVFESETMFSRAVCYYVAHNLELHIRALKDEENRMSLNKEAKMDNADSDQTKMITIVSSQFGDFKKTIWGQMFWTIYGHNSKFQMMGVY